MSTNNYAFENILVAIDDDIEDYSYIQDTLKQKLPHGYPDGNYLSDSLSRSYGGKRLFSIDYSADDGAIIYKKLSVIIRSGYYSGANLDYIIEEIDTSEGPTNMIEKEINDDVLQIKKILPKFGTELLKVAQFSNGEAVYQKKNAKKI